MIRIKTVGLQLDLLYHAIPCYTYTLGVKDYKKNGLTRGPESGNFLKPPASQNIVGSWTSRDTIPGFSQRLPNVCRADVGVSWVSQISIHVTGR